LTPEFISMQTVFLDYKTVDPGDLDLSPLRKIAPNLVLYDKTAAAGINERIQDAEIIIDLKVWRSNKPLVSGVSGQCNEITSD